MYLDAPPSARCSHLLSLILLLSWSLAAAGSEHGSPQVSVVRTPDGGIQPQAAVGSDGTVHLIYFQGDPAAGDLFYVRRQPGDEAFSAPLRVNSHPSSAVAMGTIRGGQLAVGEAGRVHVVWNGSKKAQPRVDGIQHDTPMLYTRLNDAGERFEPQRNLIHHAHGLDGGGSVAADAEGNVYVVWHANPDADGEAGRRVYLAASRDGGQTFAPEQPISAPGTGACGCCGLKAFSDSEGRVQVLYRSATEQVHRDIYLLASKDRGRTFASQILDRWNLARCPMSSAAFAEGPSRVVAGWETAGHVHFGRLDPATGLVADRLSPPRVADAQKHPAVTVNRRGETLLVWTEGTGWNRGGSVAWQLYDATGIATEVRGSRDGVPVWSLVTAFASPDGNFTIVY